MVVARGLCGGMEIVMGMQGGCMEFAWRLPLIEIVGGRRERARTCIPRAAANAVELRVRLVAAGDSASR